MCPRLRGDTKLVREPNGTAARSCAPAFRLPLDHFSTEPTAAGPSMEIALDFLTGRKDKRYNLVINDPKPVERIDDAWAWSAQASMIGLFVLALGMTLYLAKAILLPVFAAVVVGTTMTPLVRRLSRHGISPVVSALLIGLVILGLLALGATLIANPVSEWISRAPEIGATIRQKLYVLDRPLAAVAEMQKLFMGDAVRVDTGNAELVAPVVAFVTPAAAQTLIFFGTLIFYLVGQQEFRRRFVMLFPEREAKLRLLRIANDIEHNLTGYLSVFTVINVVLGVVVGFGAWAFGFPNPVIFGVLAAILNYLPYVGPGIMALVLLGVGMVTFESLGHALAAPAAFVALTTIEGHFITPAVMGRRLTLNPLMVFLSLAFWTWLWGPMGAFLAVPLSIIALVTMNHLFPSAETKLPE